MLTIPVQPGANALQAAIDSLPRDDTPVTLRLAPGTYREKITLQRANTTLEGEDPSSETAASESVELQPEVSGINLKFLNK